MARLLRGHSDVSCCCPPQALSAGTELAQRLWVDGGSRTGQGKGRMGQWKGGEQVGWPREAGSGLWEPLFLAQAAPTWSCTPYFGPTAPSSPTVCYPGGGGEGKFFLLSPSSAAAALSPGLDVGQACQLASSSPGIGLCCQTRSPPF